MNENLLLQKPNNNGTIVIAQVETQPRYHKLIRRLNGLEPGKRYMITLTVGQACDYTVQELGKVEK
jgi:hypothetical protein